MTASNRPTSGSAPLRVLVIDGVGPFGGASRSLFEVLRALPDGSCEILVLMVRGTVVPYYRKVSHDAVLATGLSHFDNTKYGHYRGIRWIILLREFLNLFPTLWFVIAAKRRWGWVDVIHGNELTDLPPVLLARALFRAPVAIHVRSLQRDVPGSWRTRLVARWLRRQVAATIAIDEGVRATLPADLPVDVVHNSFTPRSAPGGGDAALARLDTLRASSLKVGFVGNLHVSKGILDLVEAAALAIAEGADVEFVVAGGATRDMSGPMGRALRVLGLAQDVNDEFEAALAARGLTGAFHLLGPIDDIQQVYDRIDVIAFPSHFDAPGRPVFEAAFSGVPSIVAVRNPRPDTLVPGETGIAVPGQDPRALADALLHFSRDRGEVRRMGENARALARSNFVPATNAAKLLAIYSRVAGREPSHPKA